MNRKRTRFAYGSIYFYGIQSVQYLRQVVLIDIQQANAHDTRALEFNCRKIGPCIRSFKVSKPSPYNLLRAQAI